MIVAFVASLVFSLLLSLLYFHYKLSTIYHLSLFLSFLYFNWCGANNLFALCISNRAAYLSFFPFSFSLYRPTIGLTFQQNNIDAPQKNELLYIVNFSLLIPIQLSHFAWFFVSVLYIDSLLLFCIALHIVIALQTIVKPTLQYFLLYFV